MIAVTNLRDSGPGSFRTAVGARGRRTVVFRVGDTIELESRIDIQHPYLTIAGQTAPGGGIILRGTERGGGQMLRLRTHDVIIRYLRIRSGRQGRPGRGQINLAFDPLPARGERYGDIHDVIVDHVSLSWSLDENLAVFRNVPEAIAIAGEDYPTIHGITIQRCLIAEGLCPHSTGLQAGGERIFRDGDGRTNLEEFLNGTDAGESDLPEIVDIGSRRELFVDDLLIGELDGTRLELHHPTKLPRDAYPPRPTGHYATVLKDGDRYRLYYRGDKIPIHLHLVQFRVVDREAIDTGEVLAPEPGETGWKDTVIAYPGEITRVKARFDIEGLYVWHCHIVEHEDNEMMRPFRVVRRRPGDGARPGPPAGVGGAPGAAAEGGERAGPWLPAADRAAGDGS